MGYPSDVDRSYLKQSLKSVIGYSSAHAIIRTRHPLFLIMSAVEQVLREHRMVYRMNSVLEFVLQFHLEAK